MLICLESDSLGLSLRDVRERSKTIVMLSKASQLLAIFGNWYRAVYSYNHSTTAPLLSSLARWACDEGVLYEVSEPGELLPYVPERVTSKLVKVPNALGIGQHDEQLTNTPVWPHSDVVSGIDVDDYIIQSSILTPDDENLGLFRSILLYWVGHRAPVSCITKAFSNDHILGTAASLLAYLRTLDASGQLNGLTLDCIGRTWYLSLAFVNADSCPGMEHVAYPQEPDKNTIAALFKSIIQNSGTHMITFNRLEIIFSKTHRLFSRGTSLLKYVRFMPGFEISERGPQWVLLLASDASAVNVHTGVSASSHAVKSVCNGATQLPSSSVTLTSAATSPIPGSGTPELAEELVASLVTLIISYRRSGVVGVHELASGLASRQPLYRQESLLRIFCDRPGFSLKQVGENRYISLVLSGADSIDSSVTYAYKAGRTPSEELVVVAGMFKFILEQCSGGTIVTSTLSQLFPKHDRLFGKDILSPQKCQLQQLPGLTARKVGSKYVLALVSPTVETGLTSLPDSLTVAEEMTKLKTWRRSQSSSPVLPLTQLIAPTVSTALVDDSTLVLTGDPSYVLTAQDETAVQLFRAILAHRKSHTSTLRELGWGLARSEFFGGAVDLLGYIRKLPGFALFKEGDNWCLVLAPSDATSSNNESTYVTPTLSNQVESVTALFKLYLRQCPDQVTPIDVLGLMFPRRDRLFGENLPLSSYLQQLPEFQLTKKGDKHILSVALERSAAGKISVDTPSGLDEKLSKPKVWTRPVSPSALVADKPLIFPVKQPASLVLVPELALVSPQDKVKQPGKAVLSQVPSVEATAPSVHEVPNVSDMKPPKIKTWRRSQFSSPVFPLTQLIAPTVSTALVDDSTLVLTGDPSYVLTAQDETAVQLFRAILAHRKNHMITLDELGKGLEGSMLYGGAVFLHDYTRKLPGFAHALVGDNWCLVLAPSCKGEVCTRQSSTRSPESVATLFKLILYQYPNQMLPLKRLKYLFPSHDRSFACKSSLPEYITLLPVFKLGQQNGIKIISLMPSGVDTADEAHSAVDVPSVASEPSSAQAAQSKTNLATALAPPFRHGLHRVGLIKRYHSTSAIALHHLPLFGDSKRTLYTTSSKECTALHPVTSISSADLSRLLPSTLLCNIAGSGKGLGTLMRSIVVQPLVPVRGLRWVLRRGLR